MGILGDSLLNRNPAGIESHPIGEQKGTGDQQAIQAKAHG